MIQHGDAQQVGQPDRSPCRLAAGYLYRWAMVNDPIMALLILFGSERKKMKNVSTVSKIATLLVSSSLLHGCAVTPVNPTAQNVKVISEQQAKGCRFLDSINANNTNTLSKNPQEDARNRAFNRVAELGGNSLRITSTNNHIAPSGVGSIYNLSGEAYACK
jgi:hypothetical protein